MKNQRNPIEKVQTQPAQPTQAIVIYVDESQNKNTIIYDLLPNLIILGIAAFYITLIALLCQTMKHYETTIENDRHHKKLWTSTSMINFLISSIMIPIGLILFNIMMMIHSKYNYSHDEYCKYIEEEYAKKDNLAYCVAPFAIFGGILSGSTIFDGWFYKNFHDTSDYRIFAFLIIFMSMAIQLNLILYIVFDRKMSMIKKIVDIKTIMIINILILIFYSCLLSIQQYRFERTSHKNNDDYSHTILPANLGWIFTTILILSSFININFIAIIVDNSLVYFKMQPIFNYVEPKPNRRTETQSASNTSNASNQLNSINQQIITVANPILISESTDVNDQKTLAHAILIMPSAHTEFVTVNYSRNEINETIISTDIEFMRTYKHDFVNFDLRTKCQEVASVLFLLSVFISYGILVIFLAQKTTWSNSFVEQYSNMSIIKMCGLMIFLGSSSSIIAILHYGYIFLQILMSIKCFCNHHGFCNKQNDDNIQNI